MRTIGGEESRIAAAAEVLDLAKDTQYAYFAPDYLLGRRGWIPAKPRQRNVLQTVSWHEARNLRQRMVHNPPAGPPRGPATHIADRTFALGRECQKRLHRDTGTVRGGHGQQGGLALRSIFGARCEINASGSAGFLSVRKARKGAHTGVCNPVRNAADRQKDKPDDAPISHRALSCGSAPSVPALRGRIPASPQSLAFYL